MKQLIARLRELLHDAHEEGEIGGDAFHTLAICAEANLPQLLDRLEKLEAVAEAARKWVDPYWHIPPNHLKQELLDALRAAEELARSAELALCHDWTQSHAATAQDLEIYLHNYRKAGETK